jgi:hypothetical protein
MKFLIPNYELKVKNSALEDLIKISNATDRDVALVQASG